MRCLKCARAYGDRAPWLQLPNPNAAARVDEELLVRLHLKGVVPRIDVADNAINAVLPRRMRVAHDLSADRVVAQFTAPGLGPAEKNALLTCKSVDHRRRFAF